MKSKIESIQGTFGIIVSALRGVARRCEAKVIICEAYKGNLRFVHRNVAAEQVAATEYRVLTDHEHDTIKIFAHIEGILLDPAYTGRAADGLLDLIRRGVFPSHARILFWHTRGQAALFAEPYRSELF